MTPALQTVGLTKRYGQQVVVDDLSFAVERGEILGLLGPNGAGKTTTLAMLLGLVRPTSGQMFIDGRDISATATTPIGALIESPAFYPYLSGYDNLRMLTLAQHLPALQARAALDAVGLTESARVPYSRYSLGMRQRLGIAAALLGEPSILILDEPTNGLDPAGQQDMRDLIRQLASAGRTIILSSHILHDVEQVCERVAILARGRLLALDRVDALLTRGEGLFVRVAHEPARAVDVLRASAWVQAVRQEDGGLVVRVPPERIGDVSLVLAAQGIGITELRAHGESLESFFLHLTGSQP